MLLIAKNQQRGKNFAFRLVTEIMKHLLDIDDHFTKRNARLIIRASYYTRSNREFRETSWEWEDRWYLPMCKIQNFDDLNELAILCWNRNISTGRCYAIYWLSYSNSWCGTAKPVHIAVMKVEFNKLVKNRSLYTLNYYLCLNKMYWLWYLSWKQPQFQIYLTYLYNELKVKYLLKILNLQFLNITNPTVWYVVQIVNMHFILAWVKKIK